jgi:imidazole glycerol phosphate synthase glutamine amidotransferase subunit
MRALRKFGLDQAIVERVQEERPLLGICLGLQLLCGTSEESPGIRGLGVIDAHVTRFDKGVRTPQHGWNRVGDAYAYFSNSYRLDRIPAGWSGVLSDHGGQFVASITRGSVLACQFHPELSGAFGAGVLRSWLETTPEVAPC